MSEFVLAGLSAILQPGLFLLILVGVVVGIIFGAIPGLSYTMAVVLCLPMTYRMSILQTACLLYGIMTGGMSGGLISAILLNMPGTPSSVATCLDGHPMAMKGEAGKALGAGILYSFIGGTLGLIALIFIAPVLAKVGLAFGFVEYFAITLFSLTLLGNLSSGNLLKGLASGFIGLLVACVGFSSDGVNRYTFGNYHLYAGFNLVAYCIGFYAFYEVVHAVRNRQKVSNENLQSYTIHGFGITWLEFKDQFVNMIRSAFIGIGIGILPGLGGNISNFVSYSIARSSSKHPDQFGTGILDGLVASETANNATIGGAQIPLLTLGIPGDACGAFILSAMTMHGITPSPTLWTTKGDVIYSIIFILLLANFVMLLVEFFGIRLFVKVLTIPKYVLLTIIMVMCVVGAYGTNNQIFDVYCVFAFGVVGMIMRAMDFPLTPFLLGTILGPMVETNLKRSIMWANGSVSEFFSSPIANTFFILTIGSIVLSAYKEIKTGKIKQTTGGKIS